MLGWDELLLPCWVRHAWVYMAEADADGGGGAVSSTTTARTRIPMPLQELVTVAVTSAESGPPDQRRIHSSYTSAARRNGLRFLSYEGAAGNLRSRA